MLHYIAWSPDFTWTMKLINPFQANVLLLYPLKTRGFLTISVGIESDICLKWVNSPKFASKLKENLQMTPKSCCAHVPISFNAIKTVGVLAPNWFRLGFNRWVIIKDKTKDKG